MISQVQIVSERKKPKGKDTSAYPGDAVVSDEDSEYMLAENRRSKFLEDFRVIFVIDIGRF